MGTIAVVLLSAWLIVGVPLGIGMGLVSLANRGPFDWAFLAGLLWPLWPIWIWNHERELRKLRRQCTSSDSDV